VTTLITAAKKTNPTSASGIIVFFIKIVENKTDMEIKRPPKFTRTLTMFVEHGIMVQNP